MNVRSFTWIPAALVLLTSLHARAEEVLEQKKFESPQHFYFEFKLGPYSPDLDSEFDGSAQPFEHIFGEGSDLMLKGELDLELWRGFGTAGVGIVVGYYNNTAHPFLDNSPEGSGATSTHTERSESSETSITLVPVALLAIYRFDWPAENFSIPIVPFIKLGFNYTFWWIDIDGNTSSYADPSTNVVHDASGGTLGWQFNLGGALLLDVLEPSAAKTLDVELGINHTYIFFELAHIGATGLGSDTALNVGDTSWHGGIAFEF
jgi:hypothetical protein